VCFYHEFKILVLTSQETQGIAVIKPNKLIVFRKVTAVKLRTVQIAKIPLYGKNVFPFNTATDKV
jgi:hypothetical protein